jgi:hypothetical protein
MHFLEKYPSSGRSVASHSEYRKAFEGVSRFAETLSCYAGETFGNGIYTLYDIGDIERWTRDVEDAFPTFSGRVTCFARDWLCNQFCLDSKSVSDGEGQLLLFEAGTGRVLEIGATLPELHWGLLDSDAEGLLLENMFRAWRELVPEVFEHGECAGYKVPLFLGGADEVSNVEKVDATVYWSITQQLRSSMK